MSIRTVKPDWSAPNHVKACTTMVQGGVSSGAYKSLNLGDHVDDDLSLVNQNRTIVKEELCLPSDPFWLTQVHGIDVVDAGGSSIAADGSLIKADGSQIAADGSYTFSPRVALVHAGWRGLANGIIENAVDLLDCENDQLVAWAGPCIGPDAFEIGDEVRQELGGADSAYKVSSNSTDSQAKWFANLYQLAGERLTNIGVHRYFHSKACTYTDPGFYSFRRTGQCGRMASFIWIDK